MDFRIADTFTDSLARLTGEEQKAVKTTAFDLQMNPANPGMQFHKLDDSLLLCYVAHDAHDDEFSKLNNSSTGRNHNDYSIDTA